MSSGVPKAPSVAMTSSSWSLLNRGAAGSYAAPGVDHFVPVAVVLPVVSVVVVVVVVAVVVLVDDEVVGWVVVVVGSRVVGWHLQYTIRAACRKH